MTRLCLLFSCLCVLLPRVQAAVPESGFWFDPDQPGTAFQFQVDGHTVFVTWLSFDDSGQSRWLVGRDTLITQLDGSDQFTTRLQQYRDGQCLDCDWQAPELDEQTLEVTLNVTALASATLSYQGQQWQLRPYQPVRSDYLQTDYFKGNWLFYFEANQLSETFHFGAVDPIPPTISCSPACPTFHEILASSLVDVSWACFPGEAREFGRGCFLRGTGNVTLGIFYFPDITANRMIGSDESGNRILAVRLP